ncbi:MAG: zinc-dependent metalloprotease [Niabella sp.]
MQFVFISKKLLSFLFLILVTLYANAQDKPDDNDNDTTETKKPATPNIVKPYKDVITSKAVTSSGFFKVHKIDDKYFFEIPKTLLGRQILTIGRIAKAPVDPKMLSSKESFGVHSTGYAGDKITQKVVEYCMGPKNKLFLKVILFFEKAEDSTENGLSRALSNNNLAPIIASFDIKAYTPDSSAVVVDVTDFINGDNTVLSFVSYFKKAFGITTIMADRSYVEDVKAYPTNIDIKTIKTYKSEDTYITYGLQSNIILLPQNKMRQRNTDGRIPYANTSFTNFDINPNGVEDTRIISRWRLEPHKGDLAKYKKGELIEPQKPIVIYVDPATPKKWVPWIIKGINAWQPAFEAAGFKNAIIGKEVTPNLPNFSIQNSLYSSVVYKPGAVPDNNEDYITVDPVSGEIIEAHIIWNHSEMENLYKKYFVQCSNTDAAARTAEFDDALMGRLIQAEISHKVGHALGLAHNKGASATIPVKNLRNKAWTDANGISASIMDVLGYNYVAQPSDKIDREGLVPQVGIYDKWAISYGYKLIPQANTAEEEKPFLNKWVVESLAKNPMLNKGSEMATDPTSVVDVLGDNLMEANTYGINNLKAIMPHLEKWTKQDGKGYGTLNTVYRTLIEQYERYLTAVTTYFGGLQGRYKTVEQAGPVYTFVKKNLQKEALAFLNKELFNTPNWLFNQRYFSLTSQFFSDKKFAEIQEGVLNYMLDNTRLYYLEISPKTSDYYQLNDYFTDLKNNIFSELKTLKPTDQIRRMLQKQYVDILCNKIIPGASKKMGPVNVNLNIAENTDGYVLIRQHFKDMIQSIQTAVPLISDATTKYHLADLSDRMQVALKAAEEK